MLLLLKQNEKIRLSESEHLKKAIAEEVSRQVQEALATSTLEQRMQKMMLSLKSIQRDIRSTADRVSGGKDVASTFDALVHMHRKAEDAIKALETERSSHDQELAVLNAEIKRLERELGERDNGWTNRGKLGLRQGSMRSPSPKRKGAATTVSSSSFGTSSRFR